MMGVARFFKSSMNYPMISAQENIFSLPLVLFLSIFCYLESFIRVFIGRNEYSESPHLDIEL